MNESILIRNAGPADFEFVAESVIMAEKGHSDTISYCQLFGITEDELRQVLINIFREEVSHFEFSPGNFMLAECNGEMAGAYSAWVEGAGGLPSGLLKMSAFRSFLGKEHMQQYDSCVHISEEIGFAREPGTVQFESLYIKEKYRGRNIGLMLVDALNSSLLAQNPGITKAQVQIIAANTVSLKAHLKYGFTVAGEKTTENPEILKFFAGNKRLLMEKPLMP